MKSKNYFEIRGFVGNEPTLEETEGGKKHLFLNIKTEERYTYNKGDKVKNAQWHRITFWGVYAEFAFKNVKQGNLVSIEGKIMPRSYENKKGDKVYTIDFVANQVDILSRQEDN